MSEFPQRGFFNKSIVTSSSSPVTSILANRLRYIRNLVYFIVKRMHKRIICVPVELSMHLKFHSHAKDHHQIVGLWGTPTDIHNFEDNLSEMVKFSMNLLTFGIYREFFDLTVLSSIEAD